MVSVTIRESEAQGEEAKAAKGFICVAPPSRWHTPWVHVQHIRFVVTCAGTYYLFACYRVRPRGRAPRRAGGGRRVRGLRDVPLQLRALGRQGELPCGLEASGRSRARGMGAGHGPVLGGGGASGPPARAVPDGGPAVCPHAGLRGRRERLDGGGAGCRLVSVRRPRGWSVRACRSRVVHG